MSNYELEDGQTEGEKKNGTCELCGTSGATLQSCKDTWAIWNVHDQPESLHTRPAVENVLRQVDFKTIPQPRILDAWHHDAIPAASSSPGNFWPFSVTCLTVFLFEFWPRTFTIELSQKKNAYQIQDYDFGVHFSFKKAICWSGAQMIYKLPPSPPTCQSSRCKGKGYCILFNVGGQTGKDCLLTWADGVKVADRRDQTRNLSLRKRCTDHCTTVRGCWSWKRFPVTIRLKKGIFAGNLFCDKQLRASAGLARWRKGRSWYVFRTLEMRCIPTYRWPGKPQLIIWCCWRKASNQVCSLLQ